MQEGCALLWHTGHFSPKLRSLSRCNCTSLIERVEKQLRYEKGRDHPVGAGVSEVSGEKEKNGMMEREVEEEILLSDPASATNQVCDEVSYVPLRASGSSSMH